MVLGKATHPATSVRRTIKSRTVIELARTVSVPSGMDNTKLQGREPHTPSIRSPWRACQKVPMNRQGVPVALGQQVALLYFVEKDHGAVWLGKAAAWSRWLATRLTM